jgi:hypothetical protein
MTNIRKIESAFNYSSDQAHQNGGVVNAKPFTLTIDTVDYLKTQFKLDSNFNQIQGKMQVSIRQPSCREIDAFVFDPIAKAHLCTTCCCSKS